MRNAGGPFAVVLFFVVFAGCGTVSGVPLAVDGGGDQREDIVLVGDRESDAGVAVADAGGGEGGADSPNLPPGDAGGTDDAHDGAGGGDAGERACVWPALVGGQCRAVRVCAGAPGCAICCLVTAASGACEGGPAPGGCEVAAGVRCVVQCAECGGGNPVVHAPPFAVAADGACK